MTLNFTEFYHWLDVALAFVPGLIIGVGVGYFLSRGDKKK